MKKLFQAIRNGDMDNVIQLLDKKPELISCTAKQPPKKDDGQSPLQVALKCGQFEIAELLINRGADVNFIESEDCCNKWRAPVIHDAINAAVMCSRWNVNSSIYNGMKVFNTKERADKAYNILKSVIEKGADVNALDSYGNSCLWRACLQSAQILPGFNYKENKLDDDRVITSEITEDLRRIFNLLYESGMDSGYIRPGMSMTAKEYYQNGPLAQFLR